MKHIGLKEFKKLNNKEKQRLIKKFYKALKVDLLTTEEIYNKLNITGKLFGYIRDTYESNIIYSYSFTCSWSINILLLKICEKG